MELYHCTIVGLWDCTIEHFAVLKSPDPTIQQFYNSTISQCHNAAIAQLTRMMGGDGRMGMDNAGHPQPPVVHPARRGPARRSFQIVVRVIFIVHCEIVPLSHCTIVGLYYCGMVLLRNFTILQFYNPTISQWHNLTMLQ